MAQTPRLFTLPEATALLPVLTPILRGIQEQKRRLDELRVQMSGLTPAMRTNGHAAQAAEIEMEMTEILESLQTEVAEIHALGVEIKDFDRGLVDFPSLRDGKIVYLCWMVDEPDIRFWHELDTGLAGRKLLDP